MKVHELPRKINAHEELVVCFDVGKDALEGFALHLRQGAPDRQITLSIERKADQIEAKLDELADYADEENLEGLCVICEPTGGYDQELLRLARLNGHRTAYVNTEHGAKMSVIDPDGCREQTRPIGPMPRLSHWSLKSTGPKPLAPWKGSTACSASSARCTRRKTSMWSGPEPGSITC